MLEYDSWEKATEAFVCDWCKQAVAIGDSYWLAILTVGTDLERMRVCPECAAVGPPLETVLP